MSAGHLTERLLLWEERHERGEDVPAEELCQDRPELASALNARINALKQMDWLQHPTNHCGDRPLRNRVPPDLRPFPHLRLDQIIGEGGFGEVWAGFHCRMRRPVAVKVFRPIHGYRRTWRDNMRYEAERVAGLRHPGIVPILEMGEGAGWGYLAFPLITGGSLRSLLRRNETPTIHQAVRIVADVGMALDHAHFEGIIHRDVKPDNILLDRNGGVYITDFGIAARRNRKSHLSDAGTLAYMSPEQLMACEISERRERNEDDVLTLPHRLPATGVVLRIDPRTDVWSLGVVLYELLTGHHPFTGRSGGELRDTILDRDPEPPSCLNPTVPAAVERACLKCLEKNPRVRYLSAKEMAVELRRITDSRLVPCCKGAILASDLTRRTGPHRRAHLTMLECFPPACKTGPLLLPERRSSPQAAKSSSFPAIKERKTLDPNPFAEGFLPKAEVESHLAKTKFFPQMRLARGQI